MSTLTAADTQGFATFLKLESVAHLVQQRAPALFANVSHDELRQFLRFSDSPSLTSPSLILARTSRGPVFHWLLVNGTGADVEVSEWSMATSADVLADAVIATGRRTVDLI